MLGQIKMWKFGSSLNEGMHTEASKARRQGSRGGGPSANGGVQAGRGCVGHVADHRRGAGAQVYEVVLCGLIQHLLTKREMHCSFVQELREGLYG